jgi:alcohol dehydrogenase class IV
MSQIEYIDAGSIEHLDSILKNFNVKKAFLVCGKKSFSNCGAEMHIKKINKVQFFQFNDFDNNPKIEDVNKGLQFFRQSGADVIIAIGGGSAIDMAKIIRYFSMRNFNELNIDEMTNSAAVNTEYQPPLVVIPTTSGSGSEATSFAVMYVNKKKYSIEDHSILPDVVIIDPLLSMSLSPYNTAVTGMDALCHAVESYWSINSTNESKGYAKEAIKSILDNLIETVHNPTDELRFNMAKAANLAGKAINISKTTAAHAVSYSLTAHFAIPHGLAVSMFIPYLYIYNYNVTEKDIDDSRGVEYVKQTISELNHFFTGKDCDDTSIIIEGIIKKLGLVTNLSSYGIKNSYIDLILENINNQRLKNNPRRIGKEEVKKMLELRM